MGVRVGFPVLWVEVQVVSMFATCGESNLAPRLGAAGPRRHSPAVTTRPAAPEGRASHPGVAQLPTGTRLSFTVNEFEVLFLKNIF